MEVDSKNSSTFDLILVYFLFHFQLRTKNEIVELMIIFVCFPLKLEGHKVMSPPPL